MEETTENILKFIEIVRTSFGAAIAVYTMGNCYQFYEILKVVFPGAVAYESGGHVYTKIGDNFYDIRGKLNEDYHLKIVTADRIQSLSVNKWTDQRRKEYKPYQK